MAIAVADLVEIEAIKQLKARYFRFVDTKQWEQWGLCFTADAELHHPLRRAEPMRGRDQIVATVSAAFANIVSIHHGHTPEIRICGDAEAQGVWAMCDRLISHAPGGNGSRLTVGYGHYIERYVKERDGAWRIASLELRRLHLETHVPARDAEKAVFPF